MRQLPGDKYNVAWFKLAEFVTRGEKERALGLYRLLIHSFDDDALALQLEGDLLLFFDNNEAVKKYCNAAQLYQKQGRLIASASVYEHIVIIQPENEMYCDALISLYQQLGNLDRAIDRIVHLMRLLIEKGKIDQTILYIKKYEADFKEQLLLPVYETIILSMGQHKDMPKDFIISLVEKVIVALSENQRLPQFLTKLQAINAELYSYALIFLDNR